MTDARLPDRTTALVLRWAMVEQGCAGLADRFGPGIVVPEPPTQFLPDAATVCGPVVLLRRERTPAGKRRPSSYAVARDAAHPGSVVMIATDPAFGAAFGSGLALQAAVSGAAAMVTDGRWRDAGRLALLGLPVGSNGGDPTRPAGCPVVVSEREQVFGTTWERGDWFLRDRDGAVRLTRADARDAAEDLVAHPPPDLASLLADA